MKNKLYLAKTPLHLEARAVEGSEVSIQGEPFYRISNYDRLQPFFMSMVSNSDHWLFISSTGALTAGRSNPDQALFPYYTDDKIHDASENTGPKSILLVETRDRDYLWEPFSLRYGGAYRIQRNLYKSFWGNQLFFEEFNADLQLRFRYGWFNSERYGLVRRAWLTNSGVRKARVRVLDGIQNILPSGIQKNFQLEKSTLLDAYKRNELIGESGIGLFRLSSVPVDRPEPAEALKVTSVFSIGLLPSLLSARQLDRFRQGDALEPETDLRAARGAYFVSGQVHLAGGQSKEWWIVADVNHGAADIARLQRLLRKPRALAREISGNIAQGTDDLKMLVGGADGLQKTGASLGDARHFSNVLFNVMRGGTFADGYRIDVKDLLRFASNASKPVATRCRKFFLSLGRSVNHRHLIAKAVSTRDRDLERICREYLPLTFSRRHGDPSRPWNLFSIAARDLQGKRVLDYEGNWRDIFQNWEALALSYPHYVETMICRFVNASTLDGYNPYRVTRNGIDWERLDASDPWSHIGYWGDHQVIYLLKLLEIAQHYFPSSLNQLLTREIFSYANVPYRIKPYPQLLSDPKNTVEFDYEREALIQSRVREVGGDGKLVWSRNRRVKLVNLSEKLLVLLLAKFSNFIPEAGIWLNTQRPEWNDANNALVGNGVSMVTLYYLRRFLQFCLDLFAPLSDSAIRLSPEVADFLRAMSNILRKHQRHLGGPCDDVLRKRFLDQAGPAGGHYRDTIYRDPLSNKPVRIACSEIRDFLRFGLACIDQSIKANRREDGLYHAYNLVRFDQKGIPIRRLYEMLEGQVAVLSSGCLSSTQSLDVLRTLRQSPLFRPDQGSYLLYPDRTLPRFCERNIIPKPDAGRSQLFRRLLADENSLLVERDISGSLHFHKDISNSRDVARRLEQLEKLGYDQLVRKERKSVLELFERLFDHQSFTGRSGTFFGYEGLGCIYWHMVSKLLLASQEVVLRAVESDQPAAVIRSLKQCYFDIKAGVGAEKTPATWGAFPMDPYSHTPGHGGARQPGLTGQVKEDILCRFGELGVSVRSGQIQFRPCLLRPEDFLQRPAQFRFYDVDGTEKSIPLPARSLGFTYCQVPVIYRLASENSTVFYRREKLVHSTPLLLNTSASEAIFERSGLIPRVQVNLRADLF